MLLLNTLLLRTHNGVHYQSSEPFHLRLCAVDTGSKVAVAGVHEQIPRKVAEEEQEWE